LTSPLCSMEKMRQFTWKFKAKNDWHPYRLILYSPALRRPPQCPHVKYKQRIMSRYFVQKPPIIRIYDAIPVIRATILEEPVCKAQPWNRSSIPCFRRPRQDVCGKSSIEWLLRRQQSAHVGPNIQGGRSSFS